MFQILHIRECEYCNGNGDCPDCDGTGFADDDACNACYTSGECPECDGKGQITEEEAYVGHPE